MWNRRPWGFALVLALLLVACGGGGGAVSQPRGAAEVRLSISAAQSAGTETVTLRADNAAALHQLACRLAYNPRALRPLDASRGELVDSRAVFFSTTKGEGFVPVAFTYHAGERLPAESGSIAQLRFAMLDVGADTGLRIVGDPAYLIARDDVKHAIPVELSGGGQ